MMKIGKPINKSCLRYKMHIPTLQLKYPIRFVINSLLRSQRSQNFHPFILSTFHPYYADRVSIKPGKLVVESNFSLTNSTVYSI